MGTVNLGAVNAMFANLVRDHEARSNRAERKRAEADPHKHRTSRVFDGGPKVSYFWAGETKRGGHDVWFMYTTNRNAAGYFLVCRHRVFNSGKRKGVVQRDQFLGFKKRKTAKARALAKRDAWRKARG